MLATYCLPVSIVSLCVLTESICVVFVNIVMYIEASPDVICVLPHVTLVTQRSSASVSPFSYLESNLTI